MRVMAALRRYPEELRERAIRMAVDLRRDRATRLGALRRVGEQLGVSPETLRNSINQGTNGRGIPLIAVSLVLTGHTRRTHRAGLGSVVRRRWCNGHNPGPTVRHPQAQGLSPT